jgi:hypothetical protein
VDVPPAREGFTIVSKDADFHQQSFLFGHPPKVIWIPRGNCSTDEIARLPREHRADLLAFDAAPEPSFLVVGSRRPFGSAASAWHVRTCGEARFSNAPSHSRLNSRTWSRESESQPPTEHLADEPSPITPARDKRPDSIPHPLNIVRLSDRKEQRNSGVV